MSYTKQVFFKYIFLKSQRLELFLSHVSQPLF